MPRKLTLLFFVVCFFPSLLKAQKWEEKLTAQTNLVYLIPFTDLTSNDHEINRFNIGMSLGIGYELNKRTTINGNWLIGTFDGSSGFYSETFVSEPSASISYDVLPWFAKNKRSRIDITGGLGLMFFYSNLYTNSSRDKSLILTVPRDGASYSSAPTVMLGADYKLPISNRIKLSIGGSLRYLYNNDFLDAFENGDSDDMLGTIHLGAVFNLGRSIGKGEIVAKESEYERLVAAEKTAREELESAQEVHEKDISDKNYRIASLEEEINSLKDEMSSMEKVDSNKTEASETAGPPVQRTGTVNPSMEMWRVVIGSFPSEQRAHSFISKSSLDQTEMMVLYVEEINSYRVVYKSFDDINEALAARNEARTVIPDAWVIKF